MAISGISLPGGCLWIHGINDQQAIAFTPVGMEYRRDLLAEHKRDQSSRGP